MPAYSIPKAPVRHASRLGIFRTFELVVGHATVASPLLSELDLVAVKAAVAGGKEQANNNERNAG
jgi:hypothetical protein